MAFINYNNLFQNNDDLLTSSNDDFDVINGFGGNDTVTYQNATAGVVVDLFLTGFQNTQGSRRDQLISIENIAGSDFDDILSGDAGNNTLDGRGGTNTVSYARATAAVVIDLSSASPQNTGGAGIDTLRNFRNVIGTRFNDTLSGNSSDNIIRGGAGVDTVSYSIATAGVHVSLTVSDPQATLGAGTDTLKSIERLIGSNFDDKLGGNESDNGLSGLTGDDLFIGSTGSDVIDGGRGTDTVDYLNLDEPITLSPLFNVDKGSLGIDRLNNIETVIGSSQRLDVIDNSNLATPYTGTTTDLSSNTLVLQGTTPTLLTVRNFETVIGSSFADMMTGDGNQNQMNGGSGDDTIKGLGGGDVLTGDAGNDRISGGNGNDWLEGGQGADNLSGESGVDIFNYKSASESTPETARDVITGFTIGTGGDFISLSEIDANTSTPSDEGFSTIVNLPFFTLNQQLRYQVIDGNLHLFGNIDANNATAEFEIQINGIAAITTANILL